MAPLYVIKKTFKATIKYTANIEAENMATGRIHWKSRFPLLWEKQISDELHSDTFCPSIEGNEGKIYSQIFIGKYMDFMFVYAMKKNLTSS